MRKHVERINRSIEYLFYFLFAASPLAMHPHTSELFEFNKMWFVFILSLIIFFLWGTKIIILKRFEVRRTFFDIPILLFLFSQIISTIFSLDPHTSLWGYYSRFNGGLLSTISYIFLFYAFATNVMSEDKETSVQKIYNTITAILLSALLVSLWGLPSHFGYDPTCLVFRGTFDVGCWTESFRPEIRMFSTLGQPNWMGTFLAIILPIVSALIILWGKKVGKNLLSLPAYITISLILLAILMYLDLGWTLSQSSFIGFWAGFSVFSFIFFILVAGRINHKAKESETASASKAFFGKYFLDAFKSSFKQKVFLILLSLNLLFALITFLTVVPIPSLNRFTFTGIVSNMNQAKSTPTDSPAAPLPTVTPPPQMGDALNSSITESGDIRKIVWRGAFDVFKANPLFGSGVETFAFAYYKHRPIEHNLTSEWDYLYNKAHSEHINYLATTGIFGLGTYLSFIAAFIFYAIRHLYRQIKRGVVGNPLLPALIGSFIVIQVSNFFGFSVVNVNLLMFFIPLFFIELTETNPKILTVPHGREANSVPSDVSPGQIMGIVVIGIIAIFNIIFLIIFWNADIDYALGANYQRVNEFALANKSLEAAVAKRPGEDLFNNELSVNLAAIALGFAEKQDQQNTAQYGTRAKELSDKVAKRNPNNVVYWKSRTRVVFSLAQINQAFLPEAISAIETANKLAPTDAKILYNKALIYDQAGQHEKAMDAINTALKYKPNYRDAYYAKALFLKGMIEKEKDNSKVEEYKKEAIQTLEFSIKNVSPNDPQSQELLDSLK